jgi:hypothetical protein
MSKLESRKVFAIFIDIAILVVGFDRAVGEFLIEIRYIGI